MIRSTFTRGGALAAILAVGLAGCDDSTDVDTEASLSVRMTDANAQYIGEAWVDIGAVELLGGAGGAVVLSDDGTDGPVDLLELQDAATTTLADADIEADTYTQLRLIVESASVTLASGYEFTDATTTKDLTIPSGAQTGIKLNLAAADGGTSGGGVEIASGQTVLVVDFDVNNSFVIQGDPEAQAGISGVSFQPTLRVAIDDVAGSISGNVGTALTGFVLEGLVITATPVAGTTLEPFQSEAATAIVDANGDFELHYLVPGDYEVTLDAGVGFTAPPVTVTVGEGEAVADIDFLIVAS